MDTALRQLDQWLHKLPDAMNGKDLRGLEQRAVLEITDGPSYLLALADERVIVEQLTGGIPSDVHDIVTADADTMLALICEQLSPMAALLSGRVRVRGSARALLRLIAKLR